jgi:hypothetical protein
MNAIGTNSSSNFSPSEPPTPKVCIGYFLSGMEIESARQDMLMMIFIEQELVSKKDRGAFDHV